MKPSQGRRSPKTVSTPRPGGEGGGVLVVYIVGRIGRLVDLPLLILFRIWLMLVKFKESACKTDIKDMKQF